MPDPWFTTTLQLAQATAATVVAVQAAQELSGPEQVALQAAAIAQAQRGITGFNDQLLAAELTRQLVTRTPPLGIGWHETAGDQTTRLAKALTAVITDDVAYVQAADPDQRRPAAARSLTERLTRLAEGEVADASQWARGEALQAHEDKGRDLWWSRRLSPRACSFCVLLGGSPPNAYWHPVQHRLARHNHCFCSQEIHLGPPPDGVKVLGSNQLMKSGR